MAPSDDRRTSEVRPGNSSIQNSVETENRTQGRLVYALIDPTTDELRYVGKSSVGLKRTREHVRHARRLVESGRVPGRHVYCWLVSLLREGHEPEVVVLEGGHPDEDSLNEAERHHIAYLRSIGCRLTNMTDGGDGAPGHVKSPETRRKLSDRARGRSHTESTRELLARAATGRTRSPEERRKMSVGVSRGHWAKRGVRVDR